MGYESIFENINIEGVKMRKNFFLRDNRISTSTRVRKMKFRILISH